jgi:hypothetical protein
MEQMISRESLFLWWEAIPYETGSKSMLETTTQTGATRTIFELEDTFQDREYKNCATAGNEIGIRDQPVKELRLRP